MIALALCACGSSKDEEAVAGETPLVRAGIDDLQRLHLRPTSCAGDADCPGGSHCASGRCSWSCYADSDCGAGDEHCDLRGRCQAGAPPLPSASLPEVSDHRTARLTLQQLANSPACAALPVAEKQEALDALEEDPLACSNDEGCPCGAYCANSGLCRFDCRYDLPEEQPLCAAGSQCSPEGRCVVGSGTNDPQLVADLELSPDRLHADTAQQEEVLAVQVRLRAHALDQRARAGHATVRLSFADTGTDFGRELQVRCAPGAPFEESCELGAGWPFGADPDPLRSAPRTIWVRVPQWPEPEDATLVARSEWAAAPATATVKAQPVIEPPHDTGHFTGTLRWAQPDGPPLLLPVEAHVTATHALLLEPSRLLLPHGRAVLSKAPADTTLYPWLLSDHTPNQVLEARLDVESWSFDPEHERIEATLSHLLGNGPVPSALTLHLDYAAAAAAPQACSLQQLDCPAAELCDTDIGMCLPAQEASVIKADGDVALSTALLSAQRQQWAAALAGLRANHPTQLGGDDVIGVERAMCFAAPGQLAPGRLSSSNGPLASGGGSNPALDTLCTAGAAELQQQIFPYAHRTTGVVLDNNGAETFNLFDTCMSELAVTPSASHTAGALLPQRQCVSVARYLLATSAPSAPPGAPQLARLRLEHHLTRQWVALHALVARGAVQEAEFDETLGTGSGPPMQQRLGYAVDALEKAWRLVVRPRREGPVEEEAAKRPDYRELGRPVAHWTFNQTLAGALPDTEGRAPMRVTGMPVARQDAKSLFLFQDAAISCRSDAAVALPARHFSVAGYFSVEGAPADYQIFRKVSATDAFRLYLFPLVPGTNRIVATHQRLIGGVWKVSGFAIFDVPAVAGYHAFVADGDKYRVLQVSRDGAGAVVEAETAPSTVYQDGGPTWGQPGHVELGCATPAWGPVRIDEVSVWDRPLPLATLRSFALDGGWLGVGGAFQAQLDSLPPRQLAAAADDEQSQGLAAHLADGLAAHMSLLLAYAHAERAELYRECAFSPPGGPPGVARARVLERIGRGLRLAAVIENDARDLRELAGPAPAWLPRYQAAMQLLAGQRAEVVRALDQAAACRNPLGISDDDLPLYQGEAQGGSARFFAASRFLVGEAEQQVAQAQQRLDQARTAWHQKRASAFHISLDAFEKPERLRKLELGHEGALRRMCGTPAFGTVLGGFQSTTNPLTPSNCFLAREVAGCAAAESTPIRELPAHCLRGEIGEQILAIQAAEIDLRNAEGAHERALGLYDSAMEHCTWRQGFDAETQAIQVAHRAHMIKLREERRSSSVFGGLVKSLAGIAVGILASQPQVVVGSVFSGFGVVMGQSEAEDEDSEQDAATAHQLVIAAREQAVELAACFHAADDQKFAIDAAGDVIDRAYHDTKRAMLRLENQQAELRALVSQAVAELAFEGQINRVLPHHHYWLDDHIDGYRRHYRYAQRLTYLALRAFEYEAQESLPLEDDVLDARTLGALTGVLLALKQRTMPMQGQGGGWIIDDPTPVLSLRDEILRLGTAQAPPGFPPLAGGDSLRAYLASDASKIYVDGAYAGRGIRFSLQPPEWMENSCAERIWRVTTSLSAGGVPYNSLLVLWQENSFASQRCRAEERAELHVARVRPEHNLLVDEGGNHEGGPFAQPLRYTAMQTEALDLDRAELLALPEGYHAGFAGRGLYANYVLLFPKAQFGPAFFTGLDDVLIRLDLVTVTDVGDPDGLQPAK